MAPAASGAFEFLRMVHARTCKTRQRPAVSGKIQHGTKIDWARLHLMCVSTNDTEIAHLFRSKREKIDQVERFVSDFDNFWQHGLEFFLARARHPILGRHGLPRLASRAGTV